MKRPGSDLDPELEAFLSPGKIQRQVPPELRARVLDRARAIAAGDAMPPARPLPLPESRPLPVARGRRVFRIALAASFAVAGVAAGAVAALHGRSAPLSGVPSPDSVPRAPNVPVAGTDRPASEPPAPAAEHDAVEPRRPARLAAKADRLTAELDLLQRAHAAYTRRDFSVALTLVAEHARRFPKGHLAEQREALRVRSLEGSGRADEAHRAAAAFAVRFPRSVLLPRVAGGAESSQR